MKKSKPVDQPKKDENVVSGKIDQTKVPKGVIKTRSSSFGDKRTKRLRTRGARNRRALEE